jgi:hypothetical protein
VYVDILTINSKPVFCFPAFQCFYCNLSSGFGNMPTTYPSFFTRFKSKVLLFIEEDRHRYASLKTGLTVIYDCNCVCCARRHAGKGLGV